MVVILVSLSFLIAMCAPSGIPTEEKPQIEVIYGAGGPEGFFAIDIENPEDPCILTNQDTDGWSFSVFVDENYLYVADGFGGLLVFDVSNPQKPQKVASVNIEEKDVDVLVSNDHAYVVNRDGLTIVDASTPDAPVKKRYFPVGRYAQKAWVRGNYAYVVEGHGGLIIVDVSDPDDPKLAARLPIEGETFDVWVTKDKAFVGGF